MSSAIKYVFLSLAFFAIACKDGRNELSRRIRVELHPDFEEPITTIQGIQPGKVCKKGFVSEKSLGIEGNTDVLDAAGTSTHDQEIEDNDSARPVLHSVGPGWFEIALNFENKSCHFLLINKISFDIEASYGDTTLTANPTLAETYCQGADAPNRDYIYMIPPAPGASEIATVDKEANLLDCPEDEDSLHSNVSYKRGEPYANNILLIIDNLPFLDASTSENEEGSSNVFLPDTLPEYDVEMTLSGYFINQYKETKGDYKSEVIRFSTISQ